VTNEACDAARRVLSEKVHVALVEQPRVRLHYRELRLQRALQPRPPEPLPAVEVPQATVEAEAVAAEGQAESAVAATDGAATRRPETRRSMKDFSARRRRSPALIIYPSGRRARGYGLAALSGLRAGGAARTAGDLV
jgi:hypothetical protein